MYPCVGLAFRGVFACLAAGLERSYGATYDVSNDMMATGKRERERGGGVVEPVALGRAGGGR